MFFFKRDWFYVAFGGGSKNPVVIIYISLQIIFFNFLFFADVQEWLIDNHMKK